MFGKSASAQRRNLKLISNDFPGGVDGFELFVRFCYDGGRIDVTPSNVLLLHSAAKFLEIDEYETKKYFENIHFFTWSELLDSLKPSKCFLPFITSNSCIVEEILKALVEKISMLNVSSPFAFSCSDYSVPQFSGDSSTNSSRSSIFRTTNWLQDLEFLTVDLFEKLLSTMISHKLDRGIICSFLLHYQKVKSAALLAADENRKITEVIIDSLCSIDGGHRFPFRKLCDILHLCFALKMGKCWEKKVEKMIGSRLDEATLDDLLVPCHGKKTCAYDVDWVLRLLKIFLGQRRKKLPLQRLKKVRFLMDLYMAEVAPDPHLKPRNFLALALGLPDSARDSHDKVYEVMDMFLRYVSEEEKIKICSALKYGKLSAVSLVNLAGNNDFPACVAADAFVFLQSKLKIHEFRGNSSLSADEDEQILVHFLECRKEQKILENVARIHVTCPRTGRSLPLLCS